MMTFRMQILALCAVAVSAPFGGHAQVPVSPAILDAITPAYLDCMDASASDAASLACNRAELRRQGLSLNAAYQATLRRLTPPQRATLTANQAQWLAARERGCAIQARNPQGITPAMALTQCQFHETIRRRLALQRYRPNS